MATDIFCKIINKEIKADVILEEEDWLAIHDIRPQAPVHVLIIPKKHIEGILTLSKAEAGIAGKLLIAAQKVAKRLGLEYKGFRLIINQGEHGGQEVSHLHLHLLGGKHLGPKIVH